jgi:mannosyl-glycoprotein endo-beta-N-acetylglucosaminidase
MNINDVYGSFTVSRVKEFQRQHGLKAYGIADDKTLKKLNELVDSKFQVGSVHESVIQFKKDITRLGFGGMAINETYGSFTAQRVREFQDYFGLEVTGEGCEDTLQMIEEILSSPYQEGVRFEGTITLKENLTELGYGGMNINDIYGSFTVTRVMQFQSDFGLRTSGIADPITLQKIDQLINR